MTAETQRGPFAATCPTRELLDQLGDKWSVLLLIALAEAPMRFNSLRRRVEGITQKVLTQTLRRMERNGLIQRTLFPTVPVTVEYDLTPLGRSLVGLVDGLRGWAVQNIEAVTTARTRFDAHAKTHREP